VPQRPVPTLQVASRVPVYLYDLYQHSR